MSSHFEIKKNGYKLTIMQVNLYFKEHPNFCEYSIEFRRLGLFIMALFGHKLCTYEEERSGEAQLRNSSHYTRGHS